MHIQNNISLKPYNTFGIDVNAKQFVSVTSETDLKTLLNTHKTDPKFVLGGGSNMLLTKTVQALVIHINIKGKSVIKTAGNFVYVNAMAGENWHEFVLWCLDNNFGGIENLSLIPGNVGTAPIQNIGAYGVELKDVFVSCEAIEITTGNKKIFTYEDCCFDYRNSIFKNQAKEKFIITNVTLKLTKNNHKLHTEYGAIAEQLNSKNIENPTIKDVSNAVIAIRQRKLPDPKVLGNSGSFFKNPIISKKHYKQLHINFPNIPHYDITDSLIKIPAGWLIETAGFKGKRLGNYGVHKQQALVLVNYGNANGTDILKLSKIIQDTVLRLFNISLEAEVNII